MKKFEEIVPRGLIVSCQAPVGDPLQGSQMMAGMARAARQGGAVAIRANGPQDIQAIKKAVDLPIVGIYRKQYLDSEVYITPTFGEAAAIADAGTDLIALDATDRPRPAGQTLADLIECIHQQLGLAVMADVSTFEEGIQAVSLGVDAVATTLSGYVNENKQFSGPDLELVKQLAKEIDVPVIGEGRYRNPTEAGQALEAGAYAVVVGAAITRPHIITKRFVDQMAAKM